MHVKPVRYQNQRCLHFVTFSCYHRMALLDSLTAKEGFEGTLERGRVDGCRGRGQSPPSRKKRGKGWGNLVGLDSERMSHPPTTGYVVMSEHVHLLIGERNGRRREQMGVVLLARAHPPAKGAGRVGQPSES
jgi:hypothetical protein